MEENLGNKLRGAREQAGITIDDAVYLAKMPRSVVQALESDNFGFFTSPLYARSFLKQYSEYVGVDVTPWLDDLIPITLIDGDDLDSYIDIAEPPAHDANPKKIKSSGGPMAAVWMIVITGGLVWGGIKVFESFDRKLSAIQQSEDSENSAQQNPVDLNSEKVEQPEMSSEPEQKPIVSVTPEVPRRAIVVPEQ